MKTKLILLAVSIMCTTWMLRADETITVTATSTDISENLDLKTVATVFGQAKDLEEFERKLNDPDSALSNLDLNGDGAVDYLRVVEVADGNQHLVVIQAVLAKDIYQDVASIFVEKDPATQSVTVQVIGDEYIYGTNYIIEPVYIHRPIIYDWFWGAAWVCWHSPYYWDYWPTWWHPYHCIAPHLYWDHCYWHHYHHPNCSYRTGYRPHHRYHDMHHHVRRNDYAYRHPDRSFQTRNASRNISNARAFEASRRNDVRHAHINADNRTRVNTSTTGTRPSSRMDGTYGSSHVRGNTVNRGSVNIGAATRTTTAVGAATRTAGNDVRTNKVGPSTATRTTTAAGAATRTASTDVRTNKVGTASAARTNTGTTTRSTTTTGTVTRTANTSSARPNATTTITTTTVRTTSSPTRSTSTVNRSSSVSPSRSTSTVSRSSSVSPTRSSSSSSSVRSTSGSTNRSSVGSYSGGSSRSGSYSGGASRSGSYSGGSSRTTSSAGSRTR